VSGQTGVSVPTGKKMVLVSNGTDIVNGLNYIADFGTNSFSVTNLTASSATITNLIATSGSITNLVSSDASATVLRAGSATLTHLSATSASITNLALTSLTISSLSITNVSVASATVSSNLTLSGGTANGVLFLNGSKVATSGSALTFDGTDLATTGGVRLNNAQYYYGKNAAGSAVRLLGVNAGNVNYVGSIDSGPTEVNYGAATTITAQYWNISGTEAMRLNSTGLGIGTSSPSQRLHVNGSTLVPVANSYFSFDVRFGVGTPDSSGLQVFTGDLIRFGTRTLGGVFTETMRLDTSGNLGIGTTSPSGRLDIRASGAVQQYIISTSATSQENVIVSLANNGTVYSSMNFDSADYKFKTSGTERARITSGGYFKASDDGAYIGSTGAYHELRSTAASTETLIVTSSNASFTSIVGFFRANRNTTNGTFSALAYYNDAAGAYRFFVSDSGNVTNTNGSYGTISDAKMKTDIVDAGSQWADIKAVRFRKFKMKDDPQQITQLGVVAQELEQTSPGLVNEFRDRDAEGNDLGTTTKSVKSSILLMKAAVALQEAMARIEQLEAKVAALESK